MEHTMRYGDFLRGAAAAAVLAVVPLSAVGQQGKGGAVRVFSCEINGRPVFGDTLPKECYGRAWVERINGVVVYREDAQPSPDESTRRREQARRQEEERKEVARQKRQNDALREKYPSLEALDQRRDREIAELDKTIGELRVDEERLAARRKGLDDEMNALGGKPVPADLKRAINYADEELARGRAAIERKVNERNSLRQRFDADRRQYLDITAPNSSSVSGSN
ncbi:MAG: hypothetical protein FWD51_05555 [Betaproteobacteria bacterium]|nr:hypothetical protein [Betaproteobacteria bacterium]